MTDLLDNPAIAQPAKNLSATEKAALRHLDMFRVRRVRNGWFGAEKKISRKTGLRLIAKGLVIQRVTPGHSALELTHGGQIALGQLNTRKRRA